MSHRNRRLTHSDTLDSGIAELELSEGSIRCNWVPCVFVIALCLLGSFGSCKIAVAQQTNSTNAEDSNPETTLTVRTGQRFGAGLIEIPLESAISHGWHADQSIRLSGTNCYFWLPASLRFPSVQGNQSGTAPAENSINERLQIHFLFDGETPKAVNVEIAGKHALTVSAEGSSASHSDLMRGWWEAFNQQEIGNSAAVRDLSNDFLASIGRYVGMLPKSRQVAKKESESDLENQFERTLGMLLGFESVRLALMVDENQEGLGNSPAIHRLPLAVNVTGQRIPNFSIDPSKIEPIASLVPSDCFYLRCGSVNNYMWLRRFLIGWGGSLEDIVTNPTLDTDVRSRIEDQLGINCEASLAADELVSDMAVIGSDVFFAEGAGIGILFEAKAGQEHQLEMLMQQQRLARATQVNALQHSSILANHKISFFHTADNRMRSFLARKGRYVIVTNSHSVLTSIVSPNSNDHSLANLKEYQYAVFSNQTLPQAGISLYLSDPFIRKLASPTYRIELGRRSESASQCRQLECAAMVAKAFRKQADSKQALIDGKFLPHGFGVLPDGSQLELTASGASDSLRGRIGTFIPAADLSITKANENEIDAYRNFSQRYRAEWPAMDPVLLTIASTPVDEEVDRVDLQIHITPYARQEYQFLTAYLAEPTPWHAVSEQNELMGISAHLKTSWQRINAHLGISDIDIPFRIEQGELHRADDRQLSFVRQQSFAAVTPSGTQGLQVVAGLMQSLQDRKVHDIPSGNSGSLTSKPIFDLYPFSTGPVPNSAGLILASSELLVKGLIGLAKAGSIYEDEKWSIYGGGIDFRKAVREGLSLQHVEKPSQLMLRAEGLQNAAILPYLNAYSFCQSRKQSASVASWLDRWSTGLRINPEQFRTSVERTLQGSLACPLGGTLELAQPKMLWRSTKWEEDSLAAVDHVPKDFQFQFLQWLKGIELSFNLTNTSLNSEVTLQVARTNDSDSTRIQLRRLLGP